MSSMNHRMSHLALRNMSRTSTSTFRLKWPLDSLRSRVCSKVLRNEENE
jgi:hypothetical protein